MLSKEETMNAKAALNAYYELFSESNEDMSLGECFDRLKNVAEDLVDALTNIVYNE